MLGVGEEGDILFLVRYNFEPGWQEVEIVPPNADVSGSSGAGEAQSNPDDSRQMPKRSRSRDRKKTFSLGPTEITRSRP